MSIFQPTVTTKTNYENPPPGIHGAVLVALIDLGTHTETFTDKKTGKHRTKDMRQIYFCWELTSCPMSGSKFNHVTGNLYRMSADLKLNAESALYKLLATWSGKKIPDGYQVDFLKLLGKSFLVTLIEKESGGKTHVNFSTAGAVPSGFDVKPPLRPVTSREVTSTEPLPDWLPRVFGETIEDIISRSHEKSGKPATTPQPVQQDQQQPDVQDAEVEDSIPF